MRKSLSKAARSVQKKLRPVLRWMSKHKKAVILGVIAVGFVVFVTVPIIIYVTFASQLQTKEGIITNRDGGVVLLDRNEDPFFTLYDAKNKEIIPLDSISEHMQHAVIASEDQEFYEHPGFSIAGIIRSATANLQAGGISQGGSTITQQLVKNVLLSSDRTFWRKYQEVILAIELDRRFTKDEILEMYLNTVYFGEGAFGVQTAARTYYGKDASELSPAEAAMLAGVLPAPSALSPISGDREAADERQERVLRLMHEEGYLTDDEYEDAQEEDLDFSAGEANVNVIAPHFALLIQDELVEQYGEQELANSGLEVTTTLHTDWQQHAQQAVADQVEALEGLDVSNGALVAMDPSTGEVYCLVGSYNWADEDVGKINMAVAPRQPGSSFKPLVYATGLEGEHITAGTVLKDEETDFGGGYTPKNYDNTFRGDVTVRRALAISLNIPAVTIMEKVGVKQMLTQSEELGITTLNRNREYGLSLVLGSGEVPLIEMTRAFAAFANEGMLPEPKMILEIKDKNGEIVFSDKTPERERVWKTSTAYIISDMLGDSEARSEIFGTSLNLSRKAAVKTGTTDDNRDALTIGYTPRIVVGAWVGNNDNSPMAGVAGSFGAGPIWRSTMEHILSGTEPKWYAKPDSVEEVLICKEEGLRLPDDQKDATTSAILELYIRGTEPDTDIMCFEELTPTPDPTKEAERKKKEEEERREREEEERKEEEERPESTNTPKPQPTATDKPTPKPTATAEPKPKTEDPPAEQPDTPDDDSSGSTDEKATDEADTSPDDSGDKASTKSAQSSSE